MKLVTHVFGGACVSAAVAAVFGQGPLAVVAAFSLGALINWLMDLGHVRGRYGPRRSGITHSVAGALLTASSAYLAAFTAAWVVGHALVGSPTLPACFAAAAHHLLLDSFTEGGVPLLWPFSRRRYALAHADYDDAAANALGITLSAAPLAYILYTHLHEVMEWLERYASFR